MKTILIVEDNDTNLDLMVQLLEEDYRLLVAQDGLQAVALAVQECPDLVLMDMSLPDLDGWEATRRIKATPGLGSLPIIGLSAHAMSGDAEKALQAGCDGYLTKPVDFELLFETLERHLQ